MYQFIVRRFKAPCWRAGAAVLGLALVLSFPASGLAAHPKKGGTYVGTLSEKTGRSSKRVVMRVSRSGKRASLRLECSSTRVGTIKRFKIASSGRFNARKKTGSTLVFRLRGRFVSKKKAKAKLYLPSICDGKGGRMTLRLQ